MTRTIANLMLIAASMLISATASSADAITRYPLAGGSTFPIARAVEVPAGYALVFHSGLTPAPANATAEQNSAAYWGDTKTQALSVFGRMKESLDSLGLGFGDVVAMTAYLAGDPATGGRMDFAGFMAAYSQYFGTKEQPNLPSRSTVQVAGLAQPGMLVEIEVFLARPPKK
jgi:enamine deaminase RidA (YjgF/YER057c/UK114 family)